MMRAPRSHPGQLALFSEILETHWLRDTPLDGRDGSWGSAVSRPEGRGWQIIDFSHDRRTTWMRRRPLVRAPRKATSGGGGWRAA